MHMMLNSEMKGLKGPIHSSMLYFWHVLHYSLRLTLISTSVNFGVYYLIRIQLQ